MQRAFLQYVGLESFTFSIQLRINRIVHNGMIPAVHFTDGIPPNFTGILMKNQPSVRMGGKPAFFSNFFLKLSFAPATVPNKKTDFIPFKFPAVDQFHHFFKIAAPVNAVHQFLSTRYQSRQGMQKVKGVMLHGSAIINRQKKSPQDRVQIHQGFAQKAC